LAAGLPRGRGRYVRMLAEVPRFHRAARRLLEDQSDRVGQTLADFLRTGGFSRYFTAHFALSLVAAVWSCPTGTALRYPARYLFAFLANHGMRLGLAGHPRGPRPGPGDRCRLVPGAGRLRPAPRSRPRPDRGPRPDQDPGLPRPAGRVLRRERLGGDGRACRRG